MSVAELEELRIIVADTFVPAMLKEAWPVYFTVLRLKWKP